MCCDFMGEALREAYTGIEHGHGGPFGTVIVKDGAIIGRGHNRVVLESDPTLHGEVVAIRDACKNIGSFDLQGAELYTTAEPCPMCFGAALWANIGKIYYGCNKLDTDGIGFRDNIFYEVLEGTKSYPIEEHERARCLELFEAYKGIKEKQHY